jgi:hypothetical protein
MSLSEILNIERQRRETSKIIFKTVFERVKIRINNYVKAGSKFCVYTIPDFIPGYPLVNVDATMNYLLKKLTKEKFIVHQVDRYNILISWDYEELKRLDRIQKEQQRRKDNTDEMRNTIDTGINSLLNIDTGPSILDPPPKKSSNKQKNKKNSSKEKINKLSIEKEY